MKRTVWQRAWDFVAGKLTRDEKEEKPTLNETFDRAEERGLGRPEEGDQGARLLKLEERASSIERSLRALDGRLARVELQDDEFRSKESAQSSLVSKAGNQRGVSPQSERSPSQALNEDLLVEPPDLSSTFELNNDPPPRRHAGLSSRPRDNQVTVELFERALCQALGEQSSTGLETDTLLMDIQAQLGDIQIEAVPVGGQRQVLMLWLSSSRDGFAVVNPGGLADSDVMKFFDVAFGRRIFGCRQPARVVRDGNEIVVTRKGTLESS